METALHEAEMEKSRQPLLRSTSFFTSTVDSY